MTCLTTQHMKDAAISMASKVLSSFSCSRTHIRMYTQQWLTRLLTHSLTLAHSLTHAHTHTLAHIHSHTHTLTHTLACTLTLTHLHAFTYTLTLTHSLSTHGINWAPTYRLFYSLYVLSSGSMFAPPLPRPSQVVQYGVWGLPIRPPLPPSSPGWGLLGRYDTTHLLKIWDM